MHKYPKFEEHQLAFDVPTNPYIKQLKAKYFKALIEGNIYDTSDISILDSFMNDKNVKGFIIHADAKKSFENKLKTFNNKRLQEHKASGKNTFLKPIKKYNIICPYISNPNEYSILYKSNINVFDEFENEYLLKNLKYKGLKFNKVLDFNIGEDNGYYLANQFNSDKIPSTFKATSLLAETESKYHFNYTPREGVNVDFFIHREGCEDVYLKLIEDVQFDKAYYENVSGYKLKEHQIQGIKFGKANPRHLICDGTGIGKTVQAIIIALETGLKPLVITFKDDKIKWACEFLKFGKKSQIVVDKLPKREATLEKKYKKELPEILWDNCKLITSEEFDPNEQDVVTIINYDILRKFHSHTKTKKGNQWKFFAANFGALILDEAHKTRNFNSVRVKLIKSICQFSTIKSVTALTATPFEKNAHVYSLFDLIGIELKGILPSGYISWDKKQQIIKDYNTRYTGTFYQNFGQRVIPIQKKIDGKKIENTNSYELAQIIKPYFIRRNHLDIPDFPKQHMTPLFVNMSINQKTMRDRVLSKWEKNAIEFKKQTKEVKAGTRDEIDDELNGITLKKGVELRQMYANWAIPHAVKFAREMVTNGEKVAMFTHFTEVEFAFLIKELKDEAIWINSDDKWTYHQKNEKGKPVPLPMHKIVQMFKDGYRDIIIGNFLTLGTGHNLKNATHTLTVSPDWTNSESEQVKGRNWRLDRIGDVYHTDIIFNETEAERIYQVSKSKGENQSILLGDYLKEKNK